MNFLNQEQQFNVEKPKFTTTKILLVLSVFILVACAGAAVYFYKQWNDLKTNPAKVSEDETKSLVAKVGKLILLPTDETPTIATVTDLSQLKDQPFFAKAKSGDKVLVYKNAKMAYLYDPQQNLLINVTIINDQAAASQNQNQAQAQTSGSSITNTQAPSNGAAPTVQLTPRK